MSKFSIFITVFILAMLSVCWINATSLPDWYDTNNLENSNDPVDEFTKIIEKQGLDVFFSGKLTDLLAGKLRLNQDEFNALILTSLASDQQGRELLSLSHLFRAQIAENEIELGSVIDLQKLKDPTTNVNPWLVKLSGFFESLNKEQIYIAVAGTPVPKNGQLAIGENLAVKVGKLELPRILLGLFGINIEQLKQQSIKLNYLKIKDIELNDNQIDMAVRPDF